MADVSKPLPNDRHERFAQGLFRGLTADAAYIEAGFRENRGNASTLKANQSILNRVAFLHSKVARKSIMDKAEAEEGLTEIFRDKEVEPKVRIAAGSQLGKWEKWETGNQAESVAAGAIATFAERLAKIRSHKKQ